MQKLQVFVSCVEGQRQLGLSRNPLYLSELLKDPHQTMILTKPLPSSQAYEQLALWKARLEGRLGSLWWHILTFRTAPEFFKTTSTGELEDALKAIENLLAGRILSEAQILTTLRKRGYWPSLLSGALDLGVFRGVLRQYPGFQLGSWGSLTCTRCQMENPILRPCVNCGSQECWYCLGCESMGGNRGCSTLLTSAQPFKLETAGAVRLKLDFALTKAQEGAALELLDFWEGDQGQALVWAACGAGKTEVTFPLIQRALEAGEQVLFAIPRTDIVREMVERLEKAFPQTAIAAHYGGQPWLASGQLVVATTHQVLHFYQRFQLVILDEVDAFPYQGNEILRLGLLRSLAPGGKLVEMTATPQATKRYERVITIPARYHGYPLPEPQLILKALPPWEELEVEDLPGFLVDLLQDPSQPWLIFAPTIAACEKLQRVLGGVLPFEIGVCHSQEPERIKTIQRFRTGELPVLVTTSVLERGVNFPKVGVVVLYADHGVFSTSALVQIAGRVGRTAQFPTGKVLFVGARKTASITQAIRLIRQLNQEAYTRGLLHHEVLS